MLLNLLGGHKISLKNRIVDMFRNHICNKLIPSRICAIFEFVVCGFNFNSFNMVENKSLILFSRVQILPSFVDTIPHFGRSRLAGKLRQADLSFRPIAGQFCFPKVRLRANSE